MMYRNIKQQGLSLVEVVIVAAISTLVFGALLLSFRYTFELMNINRSKLSALSVANDRMEFFRSLPYDDVGTILGIPSGTIPQNSTTTLNNIEFAERVLVEYVDDSGDGLLGADSNGIITDYKRIKVEYTWELGGQTQQLFLVSTVVPRSIETTGGGGTVRINVIDQDSNLLPGADVRLFNNTVGPIDVTRVTDSNGSAIFSGAEAGSEYEIEVSATISGDDYSTAQTYQPTAAVPNPLVSPFAVLEADVSTLTFQIGELSDLDIYTYSAITDGIFTETYDSLVSLATTSNVVSSSGEIVLQDSSGVYETSGTAIAGPFTPPTIDDWHSVRLALDVPVNTSYFVQLFTEPTPGNFVLIPNSDLAGNAVGFTSATIDISELNPATYPTIFVGVTLETSDTSVTPAVEELNIFYREALIPRSSVAFDIRGNKTIGTNASTEPVYKFDTSLTTNGSGEETISDLEFDEYVLDFSGFDIASACDGYPVTHLAGIDTEVLFELVTDQTNTLRVQVVDGSGAPLPGVSVDVSRPGFSDTNVTNNCGQVFFNSGLSVNSDYEVDVSATGFGTENITGFSVDGDTLLPVTLTE